MHRDIKDYRKKLLLLIPFLLIGIAYVYYENWTVGRDIDRYNNIFNRELNQKIIKIEHYRSWIILYFHDNDEKYYIIPKYCNNKSSDLDYKSLLKCDSISKSYNSDSVFFYYNNYEYLICLDSEKY